MWAKQKGSLLDVFCCCFVFLFFLVSFLFLGGEKGSFQANVGGHMYIHIHIYIYIYIYYHIMPKYMMPTWSPTEIHALPHLPKRADTAIEECPGDLSQARC